MKKAHDYCYRIIFRKAVITLLLPAMFSISALHAQQISSGETRTVTLEEFIEKSCASYPEFRKILMENLYLQYRKDIRLPSDDLSLGADLGFYYRPDSERTGPGSRLSVSKLFPETGTSASAGWNISPGVEEPSSSITFEIYQDIAKNAFGKANSLEGLRVSSQNTVSRYQIAEAYEELLSLLVKEYYRWISSAESLKIAEKGYRDAVRLLQNTESRQASMIASNLDVNRMRLSLLDRRESLVEAEATYEKTARKIRDYMKYYQETEIRPEAASVRLDLSRDFEELFAETEANSRTFAMLDELEKEGLTSIEIRKRALLPSASLFASYSHGGTGFLPGEETDRSLSFGISMSKAFPSRKEKGELETARIDYRKRLLENETSRETLRFELYELFMEIKKVEELAAVYSEKLKSAQMIMADEERNFNIGRSALRDYIDAIKTYDSILYASEELKVRENILKIEWLRLSDSLVDGNLPDLIK